jgi:hypothetical protein
VRYGFKQEVRHPKKRPPMPLPMPISSSGSAQGGLLKKVLGWFGKKG